MSAKPLFRPDRRPAGADVAAPARTRIEQPPAPLVAPSITLLGVLLGPLHAAAVVRLSGAAAARIVAVGDDVQGWRVQRIDADRMVLRAGEVDHEVALRPRAAQRPGEGLIVHPPAATARTSRLRRQSSHRRSCRRTLVRRRRPCRL